MNFRLLVFTGSLNCHIVIERRKKKMANCKSAKKRIKVNAVKTMRNKAFKSNLKTTLKKAGESARQKSDDSAEAIRLAIKRVDQAAARNIIHKNAASRKKSQLMKKLNEVKA
jgi:small subunit ribosomal protein S20